MKMGLDAFIAFVVYRSDIQIVLRTLKTLCKALHNFFRISKGNLEMRPMFHFTERRIEAHVCICFIAYKVYKELQRLLPSYGIHSKRLGITVFQPRLKVCTFARTNYYEYGKQRQVQESP